MATLLDWRWFTYLGLGLGSGCVHLLAEFRERFNFRGPPNASGWKRMNLSVGPDGNICQCRGKV